MTARKGKSGQIAILLVLLLAGLVMLFALNVDVFTSSRSKIRLQNAADASALALARWQGITLNMIGELNLAHLAAVCNNHNYTNVVKGILGLQREISKIAPMIGLLHANRVAKENGVRRSADMQMLTRTLAELCDNEYRRMLEVVLSEEISVAQDNIKIPPIGPLADPDFYEAIRTRNFRRLCVRYNNNRHSLPNVGTEVPELESIFSGDDAPIGNIGMSWDYPDPYSNDYRQYIQTFADLARHCGIPSNYVSAELLKTNSFHLNSHPWCIYDRGEWCDIPQELSFVHFPWIREIRPCYAVMGGGATVRVEGSVPLTAVSSQTNNITAQAAAKVFGSIRSERVVDISPALILPAFATVRLVPFAFGANGRYGWANYDNIKGFPRKGSGGDFQEDLDRFNSDEFRSAAEKWYSDHGHTDADGCHPPTRGGTERGGGTPYGI